MCDHLGNYSLYTRMIGYCPVRVYNCFECGAQIAMDTLPQYLYKKMYPQLDYDLLKEEESNKLPKVDFCISLGGLNAKLLSRVCLWSLNKVSTTFKGVTFHLINRGIPEDEFNFICTMIPGCRKYVRPPIPDYLIKRAKARMYPIGDDLMGLDTEWTAKWITESCGDNQYCILSHFDLFFIKDFTNYLRSLITPKTGMLGQHCPFMLINREAFKNSYFGYRPEGIFYAVPLKEAPKQFNLYYHGDPRINDEALQTGFDNGELLELELRMLGYETNPLREQYDNHFYHFMGGDRVKDGVEFIYIQERAKRFIEEWNIPETPIVETNK